MGEDRIWKAALLVIGDEILSGRTQDKNVGQVAVWLNEQGIRLAEVRIVPDDQARIAEAVNALRSAYDYLFTTGGIGPTHDDITVDSIAAAFGVPVIVHPEARRILEAYYASRGGVTDARLRMARVPEGAELIPNGFSGAPGVRIGNVYILAGVPSIAAAMLVSGPIPVPADPGQDAVRVVQTAKYQPAVGDSGPQTVRARNEGMAAVGTDPAAIEHCPRCR